MTPFFNLREAIVEAVTTLGGSATASEVREYIKSKYGRDWKDIKRMDDVFIESESSFFLPEDRVITKTEQGKYAPRETEVPEMPEQSYRQKGSFWIWDRKNDC